VLLLASALTLVSTGPAKAQSNDTAGPEARAQARAITSSVPYSEQSVREGRKHYLRLCQSCHGKDGRALESFDFEATDLTAPDRYRHGSTDGDIFFSTKEGAGMDMPPFKEKLTDEQVWQVVWFVRSLGPESARPKPDAAVDGAAATDPAEARATDAATDRAPTPEPAVKNRPDEERSEERPEPEA
jgi:mono/diheme cytochrome c family protein